jgi:hypothetical protein
VSLCVFVRPLPITSSYCSPRLHWPRCIWHLLVHARCWSSGAGAWAACLRPRRPAIDGCCCGTEPQPMPRLWRSACVPTAASHATVDLQHAGVWPAPSAARRWPPRAIVQGLWLRPHSHLDLIGSFTPDAGRPTTPALPGRGWWWTHRGAKVASCWALWRAACSRRGRSLARWPTCAVAQAKSVAL